MAKSDDLRALVARLWELKQAAAPPTEEWAATFAAGGGIESKLNGLRVWYFDSTLPGDASLPTTGIEIREGERMTLVFRAHVKTADPLSADLKASAWKRGEWEQILTAKVSA